MPNIMDKSELELLLKLSVLSLILDLQIFGFPINNADSQLPVIYTNILIALRVPHMFTMEPNLTSLMDQVLLLDFWEMIPPQSLD